jgi:quercetin dioxygenase-like cupin family protein
MNKNKRSFQLPIDIHVASLMADFAICCEMFPIATNWVLHYNERDFSGNWNSISLYSASGNSTDIFALPASKFVETPLLAKCNYFKKILDSLLFEKESVRLLCLAPESNIHTHRDPGLAYQHGVFRLHIPIITSPDVDFIVNGEHIEMNAGECWYADFDQPHSVKNRGKTSRIHLVIDGVRNEFTDALFAKAGYDFEEEKRAAKEVYDESTKQRIVEELRRSGNPAAEDLIRQLNNE